jgi:hypothetical protein
MKREGPANGAFQCTQVLAKGNRQAAAASNRQFLCKQALKFDQDFRLIGAER